MFLNRKETFGCPAFLAFLCCAMLALPSYAHDAMHIRKGWDFGDIVQTNNYPYAFESSPYLVGELQAVSVATWVRHDGRPFKNWETIVSKGDSSFRLHLNGGCHRPGDFDSANVKYGFTFGIRGGCGDADLNSNIVPVPGKWYHVAGVYDGRQISIYIDGKRENTATVSGLIPANSYNLLIGANDQQQGRDWSGEIIDTAIWTSAISRKEIKKHLKATSPIRGTRPTHAHPYSL